jgi:hypothetical protein
MINPYVRSWPEAVLIRSRWHEVTNCKVMCCTVLDVAQAFSEQSSPCLVDKGKCEVFLNMQFFAIVATSKSSLLLRVYCTKLCYSTRSSSRSRHSTQTEQEIGKDYSNSGYE